MAMFHKSRQNYDRLFGCSATCCVGMSLSPKSKVRSGCLREVTLSDALPTAAEAPVCVCVSRCQRRAFALCVPSFSDSGKWKPKTKIPLLCRHQRALGKVVLLHLHFFPVSLIY